MSCESCIDMARERMRDLDAIKLKAKQHAIEIGKIQAICKEGDSGNYFLSDAFEAIQNACIIIEFVSAVK